MYQLTQGTYLYIYFFFFSYFKTSVVLFSISNATVHSTLDLATLFSPSRNLHPGGEVRWKQEEVNKKENFKHELSAVKIMKQHNVDSACGW